VPQTQEVRLPAVVNERLLKRILVDDEYNVTSELAEPFELLLGEELRQAVAAKESEAMMEAAEVVLREAGESIESPRRLGNELVGVGVGGFRDSDLCLGQGLNGVLLVGAEV
jgi:hypothetical protein